MRLEHFSAKWIRFAVKKRGKAKKRAAPTQVAAALALGFIGLSLLAGCDSGTEQRDAVASTRAVQRAYVPLPPGTVARGSAARQAALAAPGPAVTPELLARGEDRFRVFCTPCHGASGRGDGAVVSRGFAPPPSYREERLLAYSPEQIVGVITHGRGRMFPYADRVSPEDRWAIAHHVKRLQAEGAGGLRGAADP